MDYQLLTALERFSSRPRLDPYRVRTTDDLQTTVLYCWNIQLAESLIPTLAIFEVTLRNAVHQTLTTHTKTDWWFPHILQPSAAANIQTLVEKLTPRNGSPPTSGKVISEITFGFWQKLFAKTYANLWWGSQAPQLLPFVIPHHPSPARDTRNRFEERLEYFVKLRNRAMHHEIILDGIAPPNRALLPLDQTYEQLIETLGWIDADAAELADCLSRFREVFDPPGYANLETRIKDRFFIP